jgi:hypothetical protein
MDRRRGLHQVFAALFSSYDEFSNETPLGRGTAEALWYLAPRGWFYQNDIFISQIFQQSLPTDAEVGRQIRPREIADRADGAVSSNFEHISPYNYLSGMSSKAFSLWIQKFAFAQSSLDMARVACALERFRLTHGEYPETLDPLSPQFIDKLPYDIIDGQPLHYRRTDDAQFLLYSVGWNGTDEGGITVRSEYLWDRFRDLDKGDWVWPCRPIPAQSSPNRWPIKVHRQSSQ